MGTLHPVLVYIPEQAQRDMQIQEIREYDIDDCSPRCMLDEELLSVSNPVCAWEIFTRMREQKSGCRHPVELALREDPPFTISEILISPDPSKTGEKMRMIETPDGRYFVPVTHKNPVSGQVLPGNFSVSGVQYITLPNRKQPVEVRIFPSGMTNREYQTLLSDLSRIYIRLLTPNTGAVGLNRRWELRVTEMRKHVNALKMALHRVETMPDSRFYASAQRLPLRKVKYKNAHAFSDEVMSRSKVQTMTRENPVDIYEHRAVKGYLENLLSLCNAYQYWEEDEREALTVQKVRLTDSDVMRARKELAEEEQYFNQLLFSTLLDQEMRRDQESMQDVSIPVIVRDIVGLAFAQDMQCCWIPRTAQRVEDRYASLPIVPDPDTLPSNAFTKYIQKFQLNIQQNGLQALFFRRCVEMLRDTWQRISDEHRVHDDTNTDTDTDNANANNNTNDENKEQVSCRAVFHGKMNKHFRIFEPMPNNRRYVNFQIVFEYISAMDIYVDGKLQQSITVGEFQSEIANPQRLSDLLEDLKDDKESYFLRHALMEQAYLQKDILAHSHKAEWESIAGNLKKLLTLPILQQAGPAETLHSSYLFRKHPAYRKLYILMQRPPEYCAGIGFPKPSRLLAEPVSQLYENWCLIKILTILTQTYNFTLTDHHHNLAELVGNYLKTGISLGGRSFALEHQNPEIQLRIDYDRPCHTENKLPGQKDLYPNFFLELTYQKKIYRFCIDAKYRNYNENQMGKKQWMQDLFYIAGYKYLRCLNPLPPKDGLSPPPDSDRQQEMIYPLPYPVDGAYILHSDTRSQWAERYFWSDADRNAPEFACWQSKLKSPEELQGRDCAIGSFCFAPGHENGVFHDTSFRYFIQMIMEHFLHIYTEKCWICGDTHPIVKRCYTEAHFMKYHVRCGRCGEFWIQTHCFQKQEEGCANIPLGKHSRNYYRTVLDFPGLPPAPQQSRQMKNWSVICPRCKSVLGQKDQWVEF